MRSSAVMERSASEAAEAPEGSEEGEAAKVLGFESDALICKDFETKKAENEEASNCEREKK